MTDFAQSNVAATCSAGNFCTGNSTVGTNTILKETSEGGTPGGPSETYGVVASADQHDTIFWEIIDGTNNLEDLDGATGDWTFRLNVDGANMRLDWTGAAACRVNSSCVNQETICNDQTISVDLGTTGVKSATVNQGSAITMGATDKIMVAYALDNTNTMAAEAGTASRDQDISNQWAATGPTGVTIEATATGIPAFGPITLFKTLDATGTATPEINRLVFKTLTATATGTPTLEKVKLILQSVVAVATGVVTLSRTIFKTLSVAASGVAAINRIIFKTLRSAATGIAALVADKLAGITNVAIAVVAVGVVNLQKMPFITLSVTATGAAALQRLIFKTLVATASGIAVIDPIKLAQIVLAAVATGVVTLTRTSLITLSATATGVADLARLIFKTLAATAVGTALLTTAKIAASGVTSVTIAAVATGVATINTLYVQFVVPFTGGSGLGMLDRTQTRWKRRARTWKRRR